MSTNHHTSYCLDRFIDEMLCVVPCGTTVHVDVAWLVDATIGCLQPVSLTAADGTSSSVTDTSAHDQLLHDAVVRAALHLLTRIINRIDARHLYVHGHDIDDQSNGTTVEEHRTQMLMSAWTGCMSQHALNPIPVPVRQWAINTVRTECSQHTFTDAGQLHALMFSDTTPPCNHLYLGPLNPMWLRIIAHRPTTIWTTIAATEASRLFPYHSDDRTIAALFTIHSGSVLVNYVVTALGLSERTIVDQVQHVHGFFALYSALCLAPQPHRHLSLHSCFKLYHDGMGTNTYTDCPYDNLSCQLQTLLHWQHTDRDRIQLSTVYTNYCDLSQILNVYDPDTITAELERYQDMLTYARTRFDMRADLNLSPHDRTVLLALLATVRDYVPLLQLGGITLERLFAVTRDDSVLRVLLATDRDSQPPFTREGADVMRTIARAHNPRIRIPKLIDAAPTLPLSGSTIGRLSDLENIREPYRSILTVDAVAYDDDYDRKESERLMGTSELTGMHNAIRDYVLGRTIRTNDHYRFTDLVDPESLLQTSTCARNTWHQFKLFRQPSDSVRLYRSPNTTVVPVVNKLDSNDLHRAHAYGAHLARVALQPSHHHRTPTAAIRRMLPVHRNSTLLFSHIIPKIVLRRG